MNSKIIPHDFKEVYILIPIAVHLSDKILPPNVFTTYDFLSLPLVPLGNNNNTF